MLTDGWPYLTMRVLDTVNLSFRLKGMPAARAKLVGDLLDTQTAATDLRLQALDIAKRDPRTADDLASAAALIDRSSMLTEGAIGWYLMACWAGPRMPTQDAWDKDVADNSTEPAFKGPDKREIAGRAFAGDLCDHYGIAFEHLVPCARELANAKPPGAPEPGAESVAEVVRFFPQPRATTT